MKNALTLDYYSELIEVLFKNKSALLVSNIFAPIAVAYFLKDFVAPYILITFLILQFILAFVRNISAKLGLEAISNSDKIHINKYLKYYLFTIFFTSTLFGIISVFAIYNAQQLQVFILVSLVFGLVAGSISTLSSVFVANVIYMTPYVVIFSIGLFFSGITMYYWVGIIILSYLIITIPSSFRIYETLKNNIEKTQMILLQQEQLIANQSQLIESAKMVSVGEMIANIAHQWRQPLSSISSIASSIKLNCDLGLSQSNEEIEEKMDLLLSKSQYLSDTINTFRDFIKEKKELKIIQLQERINTVMNIVGSSLKDHHIKIYVQMKPEPIYLNMIVGELDQVIINILHNAKDILIEKNIENPWIRLELLKDNKNAIITIEDNGGGIPENILPNIFEPYFTTKHQSQGTGLGLHMSKKIVNESLHGKIYEQNTENGAMFVIELPLN